MVILRSDVLKEWLTATGRNQTWLAEQLNVTKGYVSQIINADTKVSMVFVERVLLITCMEFERLFFFNGQPDGRAFYGKQLWYKEKNWSRKAYHEEIKRDVQQSTVTNKKVLDEQVNNE